MIITESQLEEADIAFSMPLTLLVNFSLFQYLLTIYYKRRREYHGFLLIFSAFLSFAAIIPFASTNEVIADHLNDVSETASTMTFLIQISIVGRDVTKKMKIPIIRYMRLISEMLTLLNIFVLLLNFVDVLAPAYSVTSLDGMDNIVEDASLLFMFVSRFYYLYIARGWKFLVQEKKLEIVAYVLFFTHEYPFTLLEAETGLNWTPVQALWNRITMAVCIGFTVKEKFRSSILSKQKNTSNNMSVKVSNYDSENTTPKGSSRVRSAIMSKMPSKARLSMIASPSKGPSYKNVLVNIRTSLSRAVHPLSEKSGSTSNRKDSNILAQVKVGTQAQL